MAPSHPIFLKFFLRLKRRTKPPHLFTKITMAGETRKRKGPRGVGHSSTQLGKKAPIVQRPVEDPLGICTDGMDDLNESALSTFAVLDKVQGAKMEQACSHFDRIVAQNQIERAQRANDFIRPKSELRFEHRTSLHKLTEVNKTLNRDKIIALTRLGFGALTTIRHERLDRVLVGWILSLVDDYVREIRFSAYEQLDLKDRTVHEVFGVPLIGDKIVLDPSSNEGWNKYGHLFNLSEMERIDLVHLMKALKDCEQSGDDFCVMYLALAIGTLFCPTSQQNLPVEFLNLLVDVATIPRMNWAEYIMRTLSDGILKFKTNSRRYVAGCVFVLELIFWARVKPVKFKTPIDFAVGIPHVVMVTLELIESINLHFKKYGGYWVLGACKLETSKFSVLARVHDPEVYCAVLTPTEPIKTPASISNEDPVVATDPAPVEVDKIKDGEGMNTGEGDDSLSHRVKKLQECVDAIRNEISTLYIKNVINQIDSQHDGKDNEMYLGGIQFVHQRIDVLERVLNKVQEQMMSIESRLAMGSVTPQSGLEADICDLKKILEIIHSDMRGLQDSIQPTIMNSMKLLFPQLEKEQAPNSFQTPKSSYPTPTGGAESKQIRTANHSGANFSSTKLIMDKKDLKQGSGNMVAKELQYHVKHEVVVANSSAIEESDKKTSPPLMHVNPGSHRDDILEYIFHPKGDPLEILADFGDWHLTRSDFLCLAPRKQLIGGIIDCVARMQTYSRRKFTRKMLDQHVTDDEIWTNFFTGEDAFGKEFSDVSEIYILFNDDHGHWYLCEISFGFRIASVTIFDSKRNDNLGSLHLGLVKHVVERLGEMLRTKFRDDYKKNYPKGTFTYEYADWVPEQPNDYDCGVYVCLIMEHLNGINEALNEEDSVEARKSLAVELYRCERNTVAWGNMFFKDRA